MASDYEVLLKRSNGINKTVTIQDCMSEREARETAEAMYGMEVLRVIWKGRSGGSTTSYSAASPPSSDRSSGGDFDALGVIALLAVLMVVYFVVSFWYVIIPLAIIAFIVWSFMLKDDD